MKSKMKNRKYVSHTDKSHYKPNVNMLNNAIGKTEKEVGMYDFEDGKDNGIRVHSLRDLGADRVEVDRAIERMKAEGEKATEHIKNVYKNEVEKIKMELKSKSNNETPTETEV